MTTYATAPGIGACTDDANCDGGTSPPNIDDALTFLDYRFGGIEEGHIALVYLSGPKNGKPTERKEMIDLADAERWEQARAWLLECRPNENVYAAVAVFKDGTSRKKGNVKLLLSLPVENDDHALPDDLPPWSYRVETSPGRYQTYYDLTEPITDVETYQRYTAALADHTPGMGHQAIDAARLLRLPGFPNVWRAGVIVDVVYGSGEPYSLKDFDRMLAHELANPKPRASVGEDDGETVITPPANGEELWGQIAPKLSKNTRDLASDASTESEGRMTVLNAMCGAHGTSDTDIAEIAAAFVTTDAYSGCVQEHGERDAVRRLEHDLNKAKVYVEREQRVSDAAGQATCNLTALPDYGNGAGLMMRTFKPLRFLVPGILTEGAFLLVGAPKIGKSWFALWLAASVARGGVFLGKKVEQGDVLYLALEDNDRRLKDRLTMLGMTKDDLNHFTYQCEWPQLGSGGEAKLEAWLEVHPETRLVVVDILKKIRPKRKGGGTGYDDDYDELSVLQRLALKHRTTFLIVHHSRKMKSDDILEEVSGTMGTTGAVDGVLTLKRPSRVQRDGTLYVTGRDLPDDLEVPVELGKEQPRWERKQERFTILDTGGMKIDFTPTPNEAKIMQALQERGATSEEECVSAVTLVELTELSERTVKGLCSSMRGYITSKTGRGGGYWLTTSLRENV